jgi:hypothetical protein
VSRYIVRKIRLAHCKRGPSVCEKCRAMDVERICLLDICPSNEHDMQRRVIQVTIDGEQVWREFDIVRVFESAAQAEAYAREHALSDIEL